MAVAAVAAVAAAVVAAVTARRSDGGNGGNGGNGSGGGDEGGEGGLRDSTAACMAMAWHDMVIPLEKRILPSVGGRARASPARSPCSANAVASKATANRREGVERR